jgi:hypothetical protein
VFLQNCFLPSPSLHDQRHWQRVQRCLLHLSRQGVRHFWKIPMRSWCCPRVNNNVVWSSAHMLRSAACPFWMNRCNWEPTHWTKLSSFHDNHHWTSKMINDQDAAASSPVHSLSQHSIPSEALLRWACGLDSSAEREVFIHKHFTVTSSHNMSQLTDASLHVEFAQSLQSSHSSRTKYFFSVLTWSLVALGVSGLLLWTVSCMLWPIAMEPALRGLSGCPLPSCYWIPSGEGFQSSNRQVPTAARFNHHRDPSEIHALASCIMIYFIILASALFRVQVLECHRMCQNCDKTKCFMFNPTQMLEMGWL